MNVVVADTSLLVALFDRSDRWHDAARHYLRDLRLPVVTNLPVLTEATHLLDFDRRAATDCLRWAQSALQIDMHTGKDWPRILEVFERFSDLPADFTDASLVALCERLNTQRIATLDRDFGVYRFRNREVFTTEFGPAA